MAALPHDITDLYLAPTLLALDARIDGLTALSPADLTFEIAATSDLPDWTAELRADAVVRALGHVVDNHGWQLDLVPRGLRVAHGEHAVVLGLPENVWNFVRG